MMRLLGKRNKGGASNLELLGKNLKLEMVTQLLSTKKIAWSFLVGIVIGCLFMIYSSSILSVFDYYTIINHSLYFKNLLYDSLNPSDLHKYFIL